MKVKHQALVALFAALLFISSTLHTRTAVSSPTNPPAGVAPAATPGPTGPAPQIVGGEIAPPGAWPWMAALLRAGEPDAFQAQFCAGVLIAPEWVLTAAHCVSSGNTVTLPSEIEVLLGRQDLAATDGERVAVAQIIPYPTYDDSGALARRDVALLRLAVPSTRPVIALAGSGDAAIFAPGVAAAIAGWGNRSAILGTVDFPYQLHQASVPIVADAECSAAYGDLVDPGMICAGLPQGGVDSCQGDSGGPMMAADGAGGWLHVGVVSFGQGCALPNFPGIYARTAEFRDWIAARVANQPFVTILQTGPEVAAPGVPFIYTLRIDNAGPVPLNNLVISTTLPSAASFIESSDGGTPNGAVVQWNAASLEPGETLVRTLTLSATTTITSTDYGVSAQLAPATPPAMRAARPAAADTISVQGLFPVRTIINEPRLFLSLRGPSRGLIGQNVLYTVTVRNVGLGPGANANTVALSLTLPLGLTHIEGGTREGNVVRWTFDSVPAEGGVTAGLIARLGTNSLLTFTDYRATAAGGYSARGFNALQTRVNGLLLPLVGKQ